MMTLLDYDAPAPLLCRAPIPQAHNVYILAAGVMSFVGFYLSPFCYSFHLLEFFFVGQTGRAPPPPPAGVKYASPARRLVNKEVVYSVIYMLHGISCQRV